MGQASGEVIDASVSTSSQEGDPVYEGILNGLYGHVAVHAVRCGYGMD